jgi:hypothetical protein
MCNILMQSDRVTEITRYPGHSVRASGRGRRCAGYKTLRHERRNQQENADRDFFHDSHFLRGGLPPRMTTSATSSILLAQRLAFPSALNAAVNPNNPEQCKAT